jgi:hypothetical protein
VFGGERVARREQIRVDWGGGVGRSGLDSLLGRLDGTSLFFER